MSLTRRRIAIATVVAATGAAMTLTACSSTTPSTPSSSAAPATSSAAPTMSESPIGGNTLPPVSITPDQTSAEVMVGDNIRFEVPSVASWSIVSDNPAVVSVTPGSDEGGVQMVPGGVAESVGTATVTLENTEGGDAFMVTITVK